jgi:hypothetical protein
MAKPIRPRRCPDWPGVFWIRAEGSYADNDLGCHICDGRGCILGQHEVDEDTVVEDAACRSCCGSGLLVPARDLPGDIEAVLAADTAGGAWLDWLGHTGDGLVWPLPWAWTIDRRRFPIRNDVYFSNEDVMAFSVNRNIIVGLFRLHADNPRHLEAVFCKGCGEAAEMPEFILPRPHR